MLLVKTHRDALLRPLQIVSGIVERRHTLPILANILIRKEGENVSFLSTDIEVQITTYAAIGVDSEVVAITVAARKLLDILRALPEGEVSLILNNKRLTVQSGKSRFNLQTLNAEEFPTVALADQFNTCITLPQKTLKHLFSMVHFSMAQQDIRYYLNGLSLIVEGNGVIAVTTDGHRLAYCQVTAEQEFTKNEVIIPRKTIIELQRLLEDTDEPVQINIANNQIKFNFADIELVSKLVEGKFPDFNRVIPSGYVQSFSIGRESLLRSLQRSAIMTSDKFKGVRCVIAPGSLKISSTNSEQEEAMEEIEIDYSGDIVDIGFNVTYLLDVLNNLKCDQINIALGDSNSSALITVPDNDRFKYVVMPMRI
ncbi:MAG: polymerase beta subunit [Solimicrobium sp.]|jgi:DNA polymerase-3 subunit beta|nr:polymerase beta subunit [Solimicrobium sp.]